MSQGKLRTAVIVPVNAAAVIDDWRERTCEAKPSNGVPAHITLVFPFVPPTEIDDCITGTLRGLIARESSFTFAFRETCRFPHTLYLAPDPAEPFVRLTEAIGQRYPQYPPYGGAFPSIVPHLTVAQGGDELLDEAEAMVRLLLPIAAAATEALLLEETVADWGGWEVRARLPLSGSERSAPRRDPVVAKPVD